jgi:hypothetical protein
MPNASLMFYPWIFARAFRTQRGRALAIAVGDKLLNLRECQPLRSELRGFASALGVTLLITC